MLFLLFFIIFLPFVRWGPHLSYSCKPNKTRLLKLKEFYILNFKNFKQNWILLVTCEYCVISIFLLIVSAGLKLIKFNVTNPASKDLHAWFTTLPFHPLTEDKIIKISKFFYLKIYNILIGVLKWLADPCSRGKASPEGRLSGDGIAVLSRVYFCIIWGLS